MSKQNRKYKVTPEEKALIKKAANGDHDAFEQLYKDNFRFILFYTHRFFADENGYDDIVQDVVMSMWSGIKGLKDPNSFRSWLYVLIKNECIGHIRKEQRHEPGTDDDEKTLMQISERRREYIPEDNLEKNETDKFLADAITELSPGYQRIVRMYYYDEMSYQEIADELEISVKTVGSNLTKAKRMLKTMLIKRKPNMDELISHALFVVGADSAIASVNVPRLMHLCDSKVAVAAATQIDTGIGSISAAATKVAIVADTKLAIAAVACVIVAIGGGIIANETATVVPAAADEAVAQEVVVDPDAAIMLASSNSKFPDGVNPDTADLITDKGDATSWQIVDKNGNIVSDGEGSHIEAELETLTTGEYTIIWEINGERWHSIAKRDIKIIASA